MLYLYCVSCVALSESVSASVWCPVVLEHVCVWYVLVFYANFIQTLFKYQDDARSNTHKIVSYV